jgi:hypothetical protein
LKGVEHIKAPSSTEVVKPSRRKPFPDPSSSNGEATKILNQLVARIAAGEPLAWRLAVEAKTVHASCEKRIVQEEALRHGLENKIKLLELARNKTELSSRLLRTHTHCRAAGCGTRLSSADRVFSPEGNLVEIRCPRCNCKHAGS